MIKPIMVKGKRKFALISKKTGRTLGIHDTRVKAKRQERAIKAGRVE